jgi:hypothetical protein
MLAQSLRAKRLFFFFKELSQLRGRQGQPLKSVVFLKIRDIEEKYFQNSLFFYSYWTFWCYILYIKMVCTRPERKAFVNPVRYAVSFPKRKRLQHVNFAYGLPLHYSVTL